MSRFIVWMWVARARLQSQLTGSLWRRTNRTLFPTLQLIGAATLPRR